MNGEPSPRSLLPMVVACVGLGTVLAVAGVLMPALTPGRLGAGGALLALLLGAVLQRRPFLISVLLVAPAATVVVWRVVAGTVALMPSVLAIGGAVLVFGVLAALGTMAPGLISAVRGGHAETGDGEGRAAVAAAVVVVAFLTIVVIPLVLTAW